MKDPLGIKNNDPLGLKKKVASKPLSQEELWGSGSQPQDLYTSLATETQEPQQESDGLDGPPKMKEFTGFTPEEQKSLQAKPAVKVSKSVDLINKRLKLQNELSKTKVTPENQDEISRKTNELSSIIMEQDKIKNTRLSELEQRLKVSKNENFANTEADKRYNDLITNTGVWNNVKSASIGVYNNIVEGLSSITDEAGIKELKVDTDPLSEEKNQVIKDSLKKKIRLNENEINEAAKKLYKEKQVEYIETDNINSFLDNLDEEDKNLLKQDRLNTSVHLQEDNIKQEKIINAYEVVGSKKIKEYLDIEKELSKFKSQNNEIPKDLYDSYINLELEIKGISNNISKRQTILQKNKEDLGTVKQEFDFFKRQYGDVENFLLNTGIATRELGIGILGGLSYIGSQINPVAKLSDIRLQGELIDIKKGLSEEREGVRKSVESIESAEGFVNYVSDIMSNQVPSLVATSTGAGGLALIGVSSSGEKYADMNREVLEGKSTYSPLQMAAVPFLYGAAEVVSEIPTLSILKKGGRLLESISKNEADLISKSVKEKAKEWAKDWSVDTGKEIAGEEFTNFAQNFTDKYVLGKKDVGLLDNAGTVLKDTFTLTSILKAAPHVAGAILKPHQSNSDLLLLDENSRKIIEFTNQLDSNILTDKEKSVVTKQLNNLVAKNSEIISNTIDKVDNMPVDIYKKVIELNDKAANIKSEAVAINDGALPNKKELLKELSNEYKSVKDQRNALINAEYKNQSPLQEAFDKLDDAKKIKLKNEASRLLIEDARQRGLKEFEFNDKTITEKALELFKKEDTKPVVETEELGIPAVEEIIPTAEAAPTPSGQKVADIINRPATLESQAGVMLETPVEGDVYQEGQRVIFEDKNKKTYDLGNIDEISDKNLEELGIKPQEEMVSLTPEGKIKVGENEWNMQLELPNQGIEYDKDGNVKAVSLVDDAGKTVMYEGQVAEDAAYQVLLKQTETPEQRQAINEILENDEELNRQLREAEKAAEEAAAEVTEPGAPKTQAEQYSEELDKTKESDPEAYWSVSPVSAEDAAKGTIIDTPDGSALVKPDGDIAGVFKKVTSKAKGVAQDLLKRAVEAGGKKLDNFDTYLTPQYIKAGFRVVSRVPFSLEYGVPAGYNKEKHGTPDVVAMVYDPEGKLDIEEKTFDDYDEAMAYRDSFVEPSIEMELEGLAKLFDDSDRGFRMSQVDKAKEALKSILPGVKFIVHETNEAYNKATGGGSSSGTYIYIPAREGVPASRVIHINKQKANGRTVAHEVFHAVILDKIKGDKAVQEITARMVDAVYKTASPELRAELDAFAARYADESIRDEERLAELIGIIADGYPQMSQINKGIVKRWLDALAKMFGRKSFTDNEVIDLLNTLARKISTGEVVSEEDVKILGYGSVKISKDIKRESKFIDSLVFDRFPTNKNTKVIENFDLSTIDGQVATSTLSDKLTAGELKKYKLVDGKRVLESVYTFFGGIGYPEVTGRIWAASTEGGVKKIIDDMKVSSDGYRYLIPAVMSNVSHMSNKNMTSITMEVFKEAINNKEINRNKFKEVILKAFDNKDTERFKEGAVNAISGNISAIKMADNLRDYVLSSKMTFESRKKLLESMVGNPESGNPKFSTVGTFLSLAKSLTEPMAKNAELYQVPVIIRTKGNLTSVKTDKKDEFYHESYGYHIESDQDIEVLHLDGVYNLTDIIPEFTKEDGTTVSTANELKDKGVKGWDIKRILTNLGRTHGLSKYSAKIVSKKQQVEGVVKKLQQANTIEDMVRLARQSNYSDAAITAFLKTKGFSDAQISNALAVNVNRPSVNKIYEDSKKAIEDKKRKISIKDLAPFLRKSLLDRQAYIKRVINRIDNKSAKKAYDLLVTKAGASALASERFKRAEKKIYGGLNSEDMSTLDKIIYAKRMVAVNESRAKLGLEPYKGMDGYSIDDANQDLADFKNSLGNKKFNDLSNRATEYFDVFNLNLKKLYESGRISKETYDSLKDTEYSPIKTIKYVIGDNLSVDEIDTQAKSLGISRKDIMKLSDSNENEIIMDSKWLLAMSINSVEGRAFENNMLREFDKAIKSATPEEKKAFEDIVLDNPVVGTKKDGGLKYKYDETRLPIGFAKVSYFDNGNKVDIILKDEHAKQLLDVKNKNKALETLGKLTGTKILRFFATGGNPLFIIGNTAVDFQNIAFFSNVYSKFKPIATVQLASDYTKNFVKKLVMSNEYNTIFNEYINHGGALDYMASDGLRSLESMNPIKGVTKAFQKGLIAYGRAMSLLGETSEVAFRLSVFQKVKEDSIKDFKKENNREPNAQELDDIMWAAGRESRETMDFSQGGDVAKNIDAVFPYFNAALQGIRRPIDFAKKDPVGFSSSVLQYTAMASSLAAGSFAMLISAVGGDDDDEEKAKKIINVLNSVSEYEKANYHILFTGNKNKDGEYEYYRIKKLPVLSVISTVSEQLIYKEFFKSKGVEYEMDSEAMLEAVSKSNPLPITVQEVAGKNPVASGLVSYWANKDTFTGDKIFREPDNKKIIPEAEGMFDDRVDQIYKDLAPGFGLSPARTKVMVEKVITSANTNPTIPLIYSAYDGLFNKNDGLGSEVKEAMSGVGDAFGKKVVRYTDKNIIRYKNQDDREYQESLIETKVWNSEQKVYNDIKKKYDGGGNLTKGELIDLVKENFEPMDYMKYAKKYNAYIHNMNIDKSVLDIIFEDVPEVQAMKLNQRYGPNLEEEEMKELGKAMSSAGKRINNKSIYIYNKKYKNRKDAQ